MNTLNTKLRRDLFQNKGRSLTILVIIALTVAVYAGFLGTSSSLGSNFDKMNEDANLATVRIVSSPTPVDRLNEMNLEELPSIEFADFRFNLDTEVGLAPHELDYSTSIYGVDSERHFINKVEVLDGSFLTGSMGEVLVNTVFLENRGLAVGDNLWINSLNGPQEFLIVGEVFAAEFFNNYNPNTNLPDLDHARIWMNLADVSSLLYQAELVNEILLKFEEDVHEDHDLLRSETSKIVQSLSTISNFVAPVFWFEETDHLSKEADQDFINKFSRLFGFLFVTIALVALYDNLVKMINSQRNYIGTLRALGISKRKLTAHYVQYVMVITAAGTTLGLLLSRFLVRSFMDIYELTSGAPELHVANDPSDFVEPVSVVLAIIFSVAVFTTVKELRIDPREAMTSSFITTSFGNRPVFERLITSLFRVKSVISKIPVRNFFRQRIKTLVTIVSFSFSLVLIITASGMISSFETSIAQNFDDYEKYDLRVDFFEFQDSNDVREIFHEIDGINIIEGSISTPAEIQFEDRSMFVKLEGYDPNSALRKINIAGDGTNEKLVLGGDVAKQLKVQLGAVVNVFGSQIQLSGIGSEIINVGAYLPLSVLQESLDRQGEVNSLIMTLSHADQEKRVIDEIKETGLPIASIKSTQKIKASMDKLMENATGFVGIMTFIGILTAIMFSFSSTMLEVLDREMDYLNLRSIGAAKSKIIQNMTFRSAMISVFAFAIDIPLGYLVTNWMVAQISAFNVSTYIPVQTFIIALVASLVASVIGIWIAQRKVFRIKLFEALNRKVNA